MVKYRKGELELYKAMDEVELNRYVNKFPENTDYVKKFLETHRYDWVKKEWKKGRTI